MALAIQAEGIHKTFRSGWRGKNKKVVLKGIDLVIEQGEIFGILGPNGAGKTTLLSILSTLLLPDEGSVRVLGIDWPEGSGTSKSKPSSRSLIWKNIGMFHLIDSRPA